jgi:FKBP-type peptidyl-prolyl cis-trans isomerase
MPTRLVAIGASIVGLLLLSLACSDPASPQKQQAGSLQIDHIRVGSGPWPTATARVKVDYHGTFEDGRVFDSSVDRGQPASFPLNGVIQCWTQGLQQMKVGGKAKLVCPADIAYGPAGRPPKIPANATLLFEVELLGIE